MAYKQQYQLTEWLTLEHELHLHAEPCLLCEQALHGHPFPWVDAPPNNSEDFPVVATLRAQPAPGATKAAALPIVMAAEADATDRRTISLGGRCEGERKDSSRKSALSMSVGGDMILTTIGPAVLSLSRGTKTKAKKDTVWAGYLELFEQKVIKFCDVTPSI